MAGLASLPLVGKMATSMKSPMVREGIANVAGVAQDVPIYFLKLVEKIKNLGKDITETGAIADRQKVKQYKDYTLTEDISTGRIEIEKIKNSAGEEFGLDNFGNGLTEEVYMGYSPGETIIGKNGKAVKTGPQYDEGTSYLRNDGANTGEVYDEMSGIPDEIFKEVGEEVPEFLRKEKAEGGIINLAGGGRVNLKGGGLPRALQAALKAIKSKFGDDAIKTVTEEQTYGLPFANIPTPEKSIIRNKMQNFGKPGKFDEDGNIDYDYYADILDDSENTVVYGDETIEELEALLKERTDYMADMKGMYDRGELDKYAPSKFDNVNDNQIAAAVDDIFPSGDYKLDAEMAAEALVENNPQIFGDMLYDDLDDITRSKIYSSVLEVLSGKNAKMLQMKRNLSKPTATLASMKAGKGINISDPNILDEFTTFMKESDPKGYTDLEQKVELSNFNPKGKKGNADGGIIGLTTKPRPVKSKAGVEKLIERR